MSLQDPQSPPEPRDGSDHYWEVHPIEYVGDGPMLTTGLLDDPERLKASWAKVLERARLEAELTDEQWDGVVHRFVVAQAGRPKVEPAASDKPPARWRLPTILAFALTHLAATVAGALVFSLISGWVS